MTAVLHCADTALSKQQRGLFPQRVNRLVLQFALFVVDIAIIPVFAPGVGCFASQDWGVGLPSMWAVLQCVVQSPFLQRFIIVHVVIGLCFTVCHADKGFVGSIDDVFVIISVLLPYLAMAAVLSIGGATAQDLDCAYSWCRFLEGIATSSP
jgi:hypothetical protein